MRMICEACGREIADGLMYCTSCGAERQMVPEYEAEIENEIDATLFNMAKEIRSGTDGKKETVGFRFYIPKRMLITGGVIGAVLIIALLVLAVVLNYERDYLTLAKNAREAGDSEGAVTYLERAIGHDPANAEAYFMLSEYRREDGDDEGAVLTLDAIVNSVVFPDDVTQRAYRDTADIYLRNKDYAALYRLMQQCPYEDISASYLKAMPDGPSLLPHGGTYEEELYVTMSAARGSRIYYTFGEGDGAVDENAIPYTEPVLLDEDGTYLIRAVAYDEEDIPTLISEETYIVSLPDVMPPQILEDSGVYTQDTKIVAFAEGGAEIYYTTDGSDPDTSSRRYTTPITMPHGSSHFKFVAVNEDGEMSEITEREYELTLPRYVSPEQAVANIINALIEEKVLIDAGGKTMGEAGYNTYNVNGIINVRDSGEYYEIHEHHVNDDGTSAPTGLLYAVNTNSGVTYRLGYDSAGRYLLIQLR